MRVVAVTPDRTHLEAQTCDEEKFLYHLYFRSQRVYTYLLNKDYVYTVPNKIYSMIVLKHFPSTEDNL